jgi:ribosomal protein S27E
MAASDWYRWLAVRCPGCHARLKVEAGQVLGREVVACNTCDTPLLLSPKGEAESPLTLERLTGPRRAPRGARLLEVVIR